MRYKTHCEPARPFFIRSAQTRAVDCGVTLPQCTYRNQDTEYPVSDLRTSTLETGSRRVTAISDQERPQDFG